MAIDPSWSSLRPLGGDRKAGFEQLCASLAKREPAEPGSVFTRNGRPDGGIECYWTAPDGGVTGWQAKFFLEPLGSSQVSQLDESIKQAIDKYENLKHYVVCVPQSLSDAHKSGQTSARDRWNAWKSKWEASTTASGSGVKIQLWDEQGVFDRLSQPGCEGLANFWFDAKLCTPNWFRRHVEHAIADCGPRYTPEAHVDVPAVRSLAFLTLQPKLSDEVVRARKLLVAAVRAFRDNQIDAWPEVHAAAGDVTAALDGWREADLGSALPSLVDAGARLRDVIRESFDRLSSEEAAGSPAKGALATLLDHVYTFLQFAEDPDIRAAQERILLLDGPGGHGKTHLFCDVARRRVERDDPTLLLLGGQVQGDPLTNIAARLGFESGARMLDVLDAAAEAKGTRALLLIDALNETPNASTWPEHLAGLLKQVEQRPSLVIGMSIRSPGWGKLIPPSLQDGALPLRTHEGFAGVGFEALTAYCHRYGVDLPAAAPLAAEFRNPLFLKMYCQALRDNGRIVLPPGSEGITWLFRHYLAGLNKRLSGFESLNFDADDQLVQKACQRISGAMRQAGAKSLPRAEAKPLVNALLLDRPIEKSLYHTLVSEGLLIESVDWSSPDADEDASPWSAPSSSTPARRVGFAYERFTDHAIVQEVLQADDWETKLAALLDDYDWRATLVQAVSIQLVEQHAVELLDLLEVEDHMRIDVAEAVASGLLWRRAENVTDAAMAPLRRLAEEEELVGEFLLDATFACLPKPGHPLSARRLDSMLRERPRGERDVAWSRQVMERYENEAPAVLSLLEWSLSSLEKPASGSEALLLPCIGLCWFCATPHRELRDRATKGLVNLLTNRIPSATGLIAFFDGLDDLYVVERVLAAAYGAAMRSDAPAGELAALAKAASAVAFAPSATPHLMIRAYARGICEFAAHRGADIDLDAVRPPYGSTWPAPIPSRSDLSARLSGEGVSSALRAVEDSLRGDFGQYTMMCRYGSEWSAQRQAAANAHSATQQVHEFEATLTRKQRKALARYRTAVAATNGERWDDFSSTDPSAREELLTHFSEEQQGLLEELVLPHDGTPDDSEKSPRFDLELLQRFIADQVLALDVPWEAHQELSHLTRYGGRSDHRVERLGKKYQWIAYHEGLARIADTFAWARGDFEGDDTYEGPWQLGRTDLDPSVLPSTGVSLPPVDAASRWWLPTASINFNQAEPDHHAWLNAATPFGDPAELLVSRDTKQTRWYCLGGHVFLDTRPSEEERLEGRVMRQNNLWITGLLVEPDAAKYFTTTFGHRLWGNGGLTRPHEIKAFIGEHGWSPASKEDKQQGGGWLDDHSGLDLPCSVLPLRATASSERGGYDQSEMTDEGRRDWSLPAAWLIREGNLRWNGSDGYLDGDRLVIVDPAATVDNTAALMCDADWMDAFLRRKKLRLLWAFSGQRSAWCSGVTPEHYGETRVVKVLTLEDGVPVGKLIPKYKPPPKRPDERVKQDPVPDGNQA